MAPCSFTVHPMSLSNTTQTIPEPRDDIQPFGSDHANLEFLKASLPDWYLNAPKALREALHLSQVKSQISREVVEPIRSRLSPIETFATPLLTQALSDRFNLRLDVTANHLVTMHHDDYLLLRIATPLKQTLLHAALQNFEDAETFHSGSALMPAEGLQVILIWGPEFRNWIPRFRYRYSGIIGVKPEHFAEMVRTLDLGGQYQAHLDSVFKPVASQGLTEQDVATAFMNSERDALEVLAHIARMKNDISADAYAMLMQLFVAFGDPRWHGAPVRYKQLHMLDTYAFAGSSLSGALLIEPDLEGDDLPCVVYLPGDPVVPLQEYKSFTTFTDELRDRLASRRYQHYFQRFIALEQSHVFFAKLNERLDIRPVPFTERILPIYIYDTAAELYLEKREIDKPAFEFLYEQMLTKTYQDSRVIAVPTGDEDRKSRLKRWQAFESAGMDLLMVAGFFVPVLGGVMAVVAAGQLLHEAFVAVEDWTHGETLEALNHLFDIGENLAAMAALGAAVHLAPRVLPSPFIESLHPVKLRNGLTRLWKPDLARFEHKTPLPSWFPANAQGRIEVDGKSWLPLDGKLYRIEYDPALKKWRIKHPTDPELHSPLLEHNGAGAWRHEGENPMGWEQVQAFKRLGADYQQLTDQAAQRVLRITGADDALLRQVHVENLPAPALLADTTRRVVIEQQVEELIGLLSNHQLDQVDMARIEPLLNLLVSSRQWPVTRALSLMDDDGAVLKRWNVSPATTTSTEVIYAPGKAAQLFESLLGSLSEEEVQQVLIEPAQGETAQVERLTNVLAALAETNKGQLRDEFYALENQSREPLIRLIRRDFPSLPDSVARELLAGATTAQRNRMLTTRRVALSVAEQAREYQQQLRLNRVNEGFYSAAADNPDSHKAGFGLLSSLPGWSVDTAIELREGTFDGTPVEMAGDHQNASLRQVIVKTEGGYQTFDEHGNRISLPGQSFFSAVLQALPESERRAMGLSAQASEHELRALLGDYVVMRRAQVARILGMRTIKPGFVWPQRLADGRVGYPMSGRMRRMFQRLRSGASDYSPELAIKGLYPGFIDAEIQGMLTQLRAQHTGPAWEFNAFAKQRLKALAQEYKTLEQTLNEWVETEPFPDALEFVEDSREARAAAALRIKLCWKKMGMRRYGDESEFLGYELDLSDLSIDGLPDLNMSFDHVGLLRAERLQLNTERAGQFLAKFSRLRRLDLDGNLLTSLPEALGRCGQLKHLSLRDNPLVLDAVSMGHLGRQTALQVLKLDRCPVGPLLDITPLQRLEMLGMRATGVDCLPRGLLSRRNLRDADLRNNQIVELSADTLEDLNRVYARVHLHDNPLDAPSLLRAAGIFSDTARARMGIGDARLHAELPGASDAWTTHMTLPNQEASRVRWEDLEAEPNSEDFFRVLRDLTQSADFAHHQQSLTARVWKMLGEIAQNQALREEIYALAAHPQTCGDGIAIVFSDLELHVRIFNILASPRVSAHSGEMFTLVRGIARLDEVEKIALENIQIRELLGETVDHVEVRMAYRIGLAQRLRLPEQIHSMMFSALARVTKSMLADAERRVLALENKPEFIQGLLSRQFWVHFLETRFAADFDALNAPFYDQLEALMAPVGALGGEGEYLQQVAAIQKAREAAVLVKAGKLTEQIAQRVAVSEIPPETTQ